MTDTKPESRQLVKEGVWQVPPSQRPAGWESMGATEPDSPWPEEIPVSTEIVVATVHEPVVQDQTADNYAKVPAMQRSLYDWCKEKIAAVRAEAKELWEAVEHARLHKWKIGTVSKHARLADERVDYYEKIKDALEAGYCIFPTLDCAVFAIRTDRDEPTQHRAWFRWGNHPGWEEKSPALPSGDGEYVNPIPENHSVSEKRKLSDGQEYEGRVYYSSSDYQKITFPFSMAKPHIMDSVGKAMALKIFDEIGVIGDQRASNAVAKRRRDPIIVGRILHPKRGGPLGAEDAVTFLIAWHVSTKDLE